MQLSDITETLIAKHIEAKIVSRGEGYLENDAVDDAVLRGDVLNASVEGSEYEPYRVQIVLGKSDISDASCTCPYGDEWGGWCKHIAATLLLCIHAPERVKVARPLSDLLAALDRAALEGILLRLARREPTVAESIAEEAERSIAETKPAKGKAKYVMPRADPKTFRNKVRRILGEPGANMSYRRAAEIPDKISELFKVEVESRLDAGNAADALIALDALTAEYIDHWFEITAADDLDIVFPYIGELWARAIEDSRSSLSVAERASVKEKLAAWEKDLSDGYGVDDTFTGALAIL